MIRDMASPMSWDSTPPRPPWGVDETGRLASTKLTRFGSVVWLFASRSIEFPFPAPESVQSRLCLCLELTRNPPGIATFREGVNFQRQIASRSPARP